MEDLFWEHSQHKQITGYLFKNCSECNKEYKETLKDRVLGRRSERELELAGEMSAHPEQRYW